MAHWDTFENRWEITADLVARTGLRVGAGGESAEPTATDLPVLKDVEGRPYIPGSSLRGVLRSHVERIVRGLESSVGSKRGACNPSQEKEWCITSEQMDAWRQEARTRNRTNGDGDLWLANNVWAKTCRTCLVFGSPWLASRVRVADLHVKGDFHFETRDGVAIDREKETVQNKYDFETVVAATRFHLAIIAENLEDDEQGLLWLGLRELQRGHISVGGFKGRGLGQVELENLVVKEVNRATLSSYLIKGELAEVQLDQADACLKKVVETMLEEHHA